MGGLGVLEHSTVTLYREYDFSYNCVLLIMARIHNIIGGEYPTSVYPVQMCNVKL